MHYRAHTKGRIDIVHTDSEKQGKIRALILGVVEFNKFMLRCTNSPSEAALNYQLETLGELAREAETALNSLNIPVLNVGCDG